MLAARSAYLALIIYVGASGDYASLLMNIPIFLGSLGIMWFARKDERFYTLDAYVCVVFALALAAFGMLHWDNPSWMIDKAFHVAGGIGAAWAAFLLYERKVRDPFALACAVGAMWEVFEWALSKLPTRLMTPDLGLDDTILDIVADSAGALLLVLLRPFPRKRKEPRLPDGV